MKNAFSSSVALMACCLLFSGCSKDQPVEKLQTEPPVVSAGELLFKQNCKVCHAQGINGAPVVGNTKMWAGRVEKGISQLVENASNGYGLMPAKGGQENLSKDEINLIVTFMVSKVSD